MPKVETTGKWKTERKPAAGVLVFRAIATNGGGNVAAPVIDSITVSPLEIPPGGQATITVLAHDEDSSIATVTITVIDAGGNQQTGTADIVIGDPLVFTAQVTSGGGTVTQDPNQDNVFIYKAP